MSDTDTKLLADYCKKIFYNVTLKQLIEEHQKLTAERAKIEAEAKEAEARGFREGYEYGLRSAELLNGLVRREE
jgi:flagellar biosynthesis/type III secretory pathway protein FliH